MDFLECKTLDFQLQADTNDQKWIFLECETLDFHLQACVRPDLWTWAAEHAGKPYPPEIVHKAIKEVSELQTILELEGCKVNRPEPIDWNSLGEFKTPDFEEGGENLNFCGSLIKLI